MLTARRFWQTSLKRNWALYLVVVAVFAAGLATGIWSACGLHREQVGELEAYIRGLFTHPAGFQIDSGAVLRTSTVNNLMLFGAVYLSGLSVIGIPVMLGLIFVRGFALGFAVCLLVGDRGWQGALLAAAALLPQNLILIPAIVIAAVASLSFSLLLIRRGFNPQVNIWANLVRYTGMTGACLAIAAGAGLIEAYLSPYLLEAVLAIIGD